MKTISLVIKNTATFSLHDCKIKLTKGELFIKYEKNERKKDFFNKDNENLATQITTIILTRFQDNLYNGNQQLQ